MKVLETLKIKLQGLKEGFKRFPESTLLTVFLTISMIIALEAEQNVEIYRNLSLSLLFGLVFMTGLKLMIERLKSNILLYTASLAVVIGLIIGLNFYLTKDLSITQITTYLSLLGASALFFLLAPYVYSKSLFGYYCLRTMLKLFLTIFYSLVIFAGISGLVFAVESLFNVAFSEMIYMDILIVSGGIFGVLYLLSTLEKKGQSFRKDQYPKGIKILLSNILMPLTMAYGVIMYIYFIKILVTFSWPSGIVGQLVIWFGIMAFLVVFLIDGIELKKHWQNLWLRWFPYMFIIPLFMLFITISIRISNYGLTMLRYYVVVGGIWFMVALVATIFKYRHKTMIFIISGMLLLLLSGIGPISAVNLSFSSQNSRLEAFLSEEGILVDGNLKTTVNLDSKSIQKISSALYYIDELALLSKVSYLPDGFTLTQSSQYLGFKIETYARNQRYYHYELEEKQQIEVNGQVIMFDYPKDAILSIGNHEMRIRNQTLSLDGKEIVDFNDLIYALIVKYESNYEIELADMTYTFTLGDENLLLIFDEMDVEYDGTYQIDRASGIIALTSKAKDESYMN